MHWPERWFKVPFFFLFILMNFSHSFTRGCWRSVLLPASDRIAHRFLLSGKPLSHIYYINTLRCNFPYNAHSLHSMVVSIELSAIKVNSPNRKPEKDILHLLSRNLWDIASSYWHPRLSARNHFPYWGQIMEAASPLSYVTAMVLPRKLRGPSYIVLWRFSNPRPVNRRREARILGLGNLRNRMWPAGKRQG